MELRSLWREGGEIKIKVKRPSNTGCLRLSTKACFDLNLQQTFNFFKRVGRGGINLIYFKVEVKICLETVSKSMGIKFPLHFILNTFYKNFTRFLFIY